MSSFNHYQAEDDLKVNSKYEKNATTPGLASTSVLKLLPIRVSHLCERSALLQRGNALAALGKEKEARESYETVFPLLEDEPRCARVDWERHSLRVNIGNTHSREGNYERANEEYKIAERLGTDHCDRDGGSGNDGKSMVSCVKRARCFALRRDGKIDLARALLKEVLEQQIKDNVEAEKKKVEEAEKAKADEAAKAIVDAAVEVVSK